jgi:predicted enzyme related to lactoylglutathione lyase
VADDEPTVFRPGGISYLRIPSPDPRHTAAFYRSVFDWNVRNDSDEPSFEDATGHVIGHFVADLQVAGKAGVRPTSTSSGFERLSTTS